VYLVVASTLFTLHAVSLQLVRLNCCEIKSAATPFELELDTRKSALFYGVHASYMVQSNSVVSKMYFIAFQFNIGFCFMPLLKVYFFFPTTGKILELTETPVKCLQTLCSMGRGGG
jgi:hypothetical protein